MPTHCIVEGCNTHASFALPGAPRAYCKKHKPANSVNVKCRNCMAPGCNRRAIYASAGRLAVFCRDHKPEDSCNVDSKRCRTENCHKQAVFGPRAGKPLHCGVHKVEGSDYNLKTRRCEYGEGCEAFAVWAYSSRPRFCSIHKEEGMRDVVSRRCQAELCTKIASFGYPNDKRVSCVAHKLPGMIPKKSTARQKGSLPLANASPSVRRYSTTVLGEISTSADDIRNKGNTMPGGLAFADMAMQLGRGFSTPLRTTGILAALCTFVTTNRGCSNLRTTAVRCMTEKPPMHVHMVIPQKRGMRGTSIVGWCTRVSHTLRRC